MNENHENWQFYSPDYGLASCRSMIGHRDSSGLHLNSVLSIFDRDTEGP